VGTIDFNCQLPTERALELLHGDMPEFMNNYLRVLGPRQAARLGIEAEEFAARLKQGDYDGLRARLAELRRRSAIGLEDFLAAWPGLGLSHGVITHRDNGYTAELVAAHPDRFTGLAQVDLSQGQAAALRQLDEAAERGLKGLFLVPFFDDRYPFDPDYQPLYARCQELNLPVSIHCSMHYALGRRVDFARPIHLDQVAVAFPDLTIIARLGGWPWVAELVGLAIRHPRLYINLSSHRPRYLAAPGAGWEALFHFGQNVLKDKVIFGSSWLDLGLDLAQVYQEFDGLPLDKDIKILWLETNAARLLGLAAGPE